MDVWDEHNAYAPIMHFVKQHFGPPDWNAVAHYRKVPRCCATCAHSKADWDNEHFCTHPAAVRYKGSDIREPEVKGWAVCDWHVQVGVCPHCANRPQIKAALPTTTHSTGDMSASTVSSNVSLPSAVAQQAEAVNHASMRADQDLHAIPLFTAWTQCQCGMSGPRVLVKDPETAIQEACAAWNEAFAQPDGSDGDDTRDCEVEDLDGP